MISIRVIHDLGRWIDADTGEIVEFVGGYKVIPMARAKMAEIPCCMPWVKLYRLPSSLGLTPNEWKMLGCILTPYKLMLGEGNVICDSNGTPASLGHIAKTAFVYGERKAQMAMQGLKEKQIAEKSKGKFVLSRSVAERGTGTADRANGFVKLCYLPYNLGLKPSEWKVLGAIVCNEHIRAKDNVICDSNGQAASLKDMSRWAGIANGTVARRSIRALMEKHMIAAHDGMYVLNWLVATKGRGYIAKWARGLFPKYGYTSAGFPVDDYVDE